MELEEDGGLLVMSGQLEGAYWIARLFICQRLSAY